VRGLAAGGTVVAREGPYTRIAAFASLALVLLGYLGLAASQKWFPFASGEARALPAPARSTSPGPVSTGTPVPSSAVRSVAYLDAGAPASGGPVGRGLVSISGRSFRRSIWLQFAESCCGSQQSVAYRVRSGYREFTGALGEQQVAGLPSGYTMLFSISVNGQQVMDNRQVQLGDPAVPFHIRLPGTSATILIDVTADCPNIYCAGNAVVGNARVVPIRTG
jgi:hypothetical protein